MEKLPELFDMEDIRSRVDEFTPYIMVAIQVPQMLIEHVMPRTRFMVVSCKYSIHFRNAIGCEALSNCSQS